MSRVSVAALAVALLAASGSGQATLDSLAVKAVAEVETQSMHGGHEIVKLAPADRVVPGDQVVYTLEIRNVAAVTAVTPTVTYAVPAHVAYVVDSATGPGAEITYSVDGGRTFDRPDKLEMADRDGNARSAIASNYTHIRWHFKNNLKPKSVAYARFRAIVK